MFNELLLFAENKEVCVSILGNTLKVKSKDLPAIDAVLIDLKSKPYMSEDDIDIIDNFLLVSKETQNKLSKLRELYLDIESNENDKFLDFVSTMPATKDADFINWTTYIFRDVDSDFIKIGKTRNIGERLNTLRLNSGRDLIIHATFNADIECFLHGIFSDYRKNGEWFCVGVKALDEKLHEIQPDIFID